MPRQHPDHDENYLCPLSQAMPYLARSTFSFEEEDIEVLQPYFNFQHEQKHLLKQMERFGESLGASKSAVQEALAAAQKAQDTFERACRERGREIMTQLGNYRQAVVILSRPYNGCDPGLNLGLPKKLHDMGVLAIPMDFLPAGDDEKMSRLATMYWKSGQRILSAAEQIKDHPQLHGIFITNFKCGPDSFISHFLHHRMTGKPYLQLEVDEHSADAGVITRCEAFFDSLERKPAAPRKENTAAQQIRGSDQQTGGEEFHASAS
jgi:predicted nucleotide-binding protein (sugar kinase/HSP70/actin superfamily)